MRRVKHAPRSGRGMQITPLLTGRAATAPSPSSRRLRELFGVDLGARDAPFDEERLDRLDHRHDTANIDFFPFGVRQATTEHPLHPSGVPRPRLRPTDRRDKMKRGAFGGQTPPFRLVQDLVLVPNPEEQPDRLVESLALV